ncbi:MAG: (Fe-S)-binding protein [Desulfobacterota bacterium]|nr:(Fe-S)-binding protein [Thermodesulfobacteriota bacterium]MDW8001194.1 (Fe-S)-binding protein [Deltaproteobacteria bacterium]
MIKKEEMFDTPKKEVSLDVTDLRNFVYDMSRCIKCKGCYWVDHIYMPGIDFMVRCPSNLWKDFDSYGAFGKMRIGIALFEGRLSWSEKLLEILYACTLCGACDVGCKRNLDLEIGLTLEALRIKAVKDRVAPLPAHKKIIENIQKTHNKFGVDNKGRRAWAEKVPLDDTSDLIYFVGCSSSFVNREIPLAVSEVLSKTNKKFALFDNEWCCGNVPYSVGAYEEAKAIARRNVEYVRSKGCKTVLLSCAECYRMWKVDYPKLLGISTDDLGFEVIHFIEYVEKAKKEGLLKLTKPIKKRLTYHDSCGVSRLCDPWINWKGTRGWMGIVEPKLKRRRGTYGLYFQAREILSSIPGLKFVEMPRTRENSLCCGAGRGTKEAFPQFTEFIVNERMREVKHVGAELLVSACPWCKTNFKRAIKDGDGIEVLDISELVALSME